MYEFEYTNGLYEQEVDLIIKFINKELTLIRKNKKNLVKFAYSESVKGKMIFLDFERIMNEVQRMSIEINYLENKRVSYNKIKEKQEQQ
jgi:hypothetical protein